MAKSSKSIILEGGIALLVNAAGRVFQFLAIVLVARFLGREAFGEFTFLLSTLAVLMIFTVPGLDTYVSREIPGMLVKGRRKESCSLVCLCVCVVVGVSLLLGASLLIANIYFEKISGILTFFILLLLVLRSLLHLNRRSLYGFNKRIQCLMPDGFLFPLFFLLLVAALYYSLDEVVVRLFEGRSEVVGLLFSDSLNRVMLCYTISVIVALAFSFFFLKNAMSSYSLPDKDSGNSVSFILKCSIALGAISFVKVINVNGDVLMLGMLSSNADVGVYKAAQQFIMILQFGLGSLGVPIARDIAQLYAEDKKDELQQLLRKGARLLFFAGFPILLSLYMFANPLLLVFGPEYQMGSGALRILCVGQFFLISMGFVGVLLIMIGEEKVALWGWSIGAVLNLLLNAVLIPYWGVEGAAIATSAGWSVSLVFMTFVSIRRVGFNPLPFG